ncbi:MAG TPA: PLP-dependent transferase [Candidatus Binatia bacterium]|nr:PLP-dependent transferase [Candidatus Binatia bacterium]
MQNPVWEGRDLGQPIPASTHAVSVALPRWRDVVGYEEKTAEVMARLSSGYPRFVVHPLVQKIAKEAGAGEPCLPFPSRRAAELCAGFVGRVNGAKAQVVAAKDLWLVSASGTGNNALRAFWQHAGLIVSSRQAQAHLEGRGPGPDDEAIRRSLRRQLAGFYDCAEDDVFLAPTGMAALFAALQAALQRTPGRPTAQLGFPYVDTLKLQQKLGPGGILLHHLESIEVKLRSLLERERLAACFCEIPGNPLLGCADLRTISPLLRRHRVPLIADDVVATSVNVDLSGHADLIATSLTKFIVGTCDAMGGALICNPKSPLYSELKAIVLAQHEELLWGEDARVLERQARDFPERMKRHNQNGLLIAERLRGHPAVERVWYPKWEFSEAYEAVRRPGGGWGALLTFLPRDAQTSSPRIYDKMPFCKGPSLGAVFTLACPFTLLAHYTELDWAEACGVSRYLIRLSVGLEEPEELWQRLEAALR